MLVVKSLTANAEDIRDMGSNSGQGSSPGGWQGNSLSTLAWRIPRTEEPGRLQSIALLRVGHD